MSQLAIERPKRAYARHAAVDNVSHHEKRPGAWMPQALPVQIERRLPSLEDYDRAMR